MIFFSFFWVKVAVVRCLELSQLALPSSETAALQQLYDATAGPHWTIFGVPWNFTGFHNPCVEGWEGVECTCMGNNNPPVFPWQYISYIYLPYYYDDGTGVKELSCHISKLSLGFSNLEGPLPSSVGSDLPFLTRLHLEGNKLSTSIPSTLGLLSSLQYLALSTNSLTGVIPTSLGAATALQIVVIVGNSITGSLPTSLGLLDQLMIAYFEDSFLTGPIPTSIGGLTALQILATANNYLSSSIPSGLGAAVSLTVIDFADNALTGSFPPSLCNLRELYELNLIENFLTGTLPTSLGLLQRLNLLAMYQNILSGSIPSELGYSTALTVVFLHDNALSGSIPSTLSELVNVSELWLYSNQMTGKIPSTLRSITAMQLLLLGNNHFSGNLDDLFDPEVQRQFQVMDVSTNQLTGSLPTALFQIESVTTVAMVGNCFSGTLPSEMCSATSLQVLALDGLHTAPSCQDRFDSITTSYALQPRGSMQGTIPACLYSMPNLTTLHLTGNGLTGSIADTISPTSHFVNLSLSNNILTGPIPQWVQAHQWTRLSLSYNRLSGLLSSSMQVKANSSLALGVNRLSGDIPLSLKYAPSIAILEGNLFACDVNRQSLPVNDPNVESYQCASDDLNISLGVWGIAVVCFSLLLVIVVRLSGSPSTAIFFKNNIKCAKLFDVGMLTALSEVVTERKSSFGTALGTARSFACLAVGLICCVLMPTYGALSVYYKNHVNLYTWAVSVPFLSGTTPAVVVIVVWTAVGAVLCVVVADHCAAVPRSTPSNKQTGHKPINISKLCRRVLVWGALVTADMVIMGGLNAAYVVAVTSGSSSLVHATTYLEVVLGMVKSFWNSLVLPRAFKLVLAWEHVVAEEDKDEAAEGHEHGRNLVWPVCELVTVCNNIILPCVVVALVDPNCFVQVLVPAASIDASYSYEYCDELGSDASTCFLYQEVEVVVSYSPPFIYNYQCSSALLTNYAAVYAYVIAFSSFVSPIVGWLYYGDHLAVKFRAERFAIQLVNISAILVTFGVVFPPLAMMALLAVFVETHWAQALMVKAVKMAANEVEKSERRIAMKKSIELMTEMLLSSVWLLLPLSIIFNAFFAFDVIGDHLGWRLAFGGFIAVTVGLPIVLGAIFVIRRRAVAGGGARPLLWSTAATWPSVRGEEIRAGDDGFPITDDGEGVSVSFVTGSGKSHIMRSDCDDNTASISAGESTHADDDVFNETFDRSSAV